MNHDPRSDRHAPPIAGGPASRLLLDVARAALSRYGGDRWVVRPTEAWCHVTPPDDVPRRQGWKLHVSATPLSAPMVLAQASEVLIRGGCSFKFATDLVRVAQLVDIWYDRGGSGKFITAYPRDDEQFRAMATALHEATDGLAGPQILSDKQFRRRSLVHSRYGAFQGYRRLTDDGLLVTELNGPDGRAISDTRNSWFSPPPWAVYPFPDEPAPSATPADSVRLAGRFRVYRAIRHANKGGVYRAIDEGDGAEVIVKQARAHVGARLDGTDVRDQLRKEARMLESLAPLGLTPGRVALIEEQDDLFLVEQAIAGESLDTTAYVSSDMLTAERLLSLTRQLVELVRKVHDAGFVINDLKPQNVMVTPTSGLMLVDVEHVTEQGTSWAPAFTPHYGAPEVEAMARRGHTSLVAQPSADCFSLGVTIFCVTTGLAPAWVSSQGAREDVLWRISRDHPEMEPFRELIVGLTDADPAQRWSLKQAQEYLEAPPANGHRMSTAPPKRPANPAPSLDHLIRDGLAQLQRTMTPHQESLWRMVPLTRGEADPCNAWNGAAGGLRALTRAYQMGNEPSLRQTLAEAASWVDGRLLTIARLLPGLAFGRSGTAWALFEAATLLEDEEMAAHSVGLAKRLPLAGPSPDITHGLAGAGLAHLHLWAATGDEELRQRVLAYAEAVLNAADRTEDGWSWPTSRDTDSILAGQNVYGAAHGVAGVGDFLLAAAQACTVDDRAGGLRERCLQAARGAADTLIDAARTTDREIYWPEAVGGSGSSSDGGQWCNGPSGIGGFLIRAWSATHERRYADVAVQCATTVVGQSWRFAAGACCGLAGVGHFLLDLADITGQTNFRTDADHLAAVLQAQSHVADGLVIAGRDDIGLDYANGLAGVLDFLIRLRHGGPHPWWPSQRVVAADARHP